MKKNIRNIAVIAHVDHGKTTLVDALLKQTHVFRENQEEMGQERILDTGELERERGITILAKNCAISYKDIKINIVDTPGHADFSGEVERTLSMADGALLIVDAQEGPMPQTRFVLRKALSLGLKIIVVINKIDKRFSRVAYVENKIESLFLELAKDESQLEFPFLYAVGRTGKVFEKMPNDLEAPGDVTPLLDKIIEYVSPPESSDEKPFKMLVSSIYYDSHLGKIAVGKIHQGKVSLGDKVVLSSKPNNVRKVERVFVFEGLNRKEVESAGSGDIAFVAGVEEIKIGETMASPEETSPLPPIEIGEPTIHITLGVNTSPFSGREGKFSTSRQIEERMTKELEKNLSLRVTKREDGKFDVAGRGELHLAILLENLRREGYEMEVEKPEVIIKEIDGVKKEPYEEVDVIVPTEHIGIINQEFGKRYANFIKMEPINENETEFIYQVPTRAIIGLRSLLLTMTKGTLLFNSQLIGYEPIGRAIPKIRSGVLIASSPGEALAYGLQATQERGITFVSPGTKVYEGMIVGRNAKSDDITVNVCKGKKLTNMRSKSSDGVIQLAPPVILSLEQSLDFIERDELLEITPTSLRLRKKSLTEIDRKRMQRKDRLV
ncbi:translational GTPase TypA [Candidatus Woesebacteria bacterium]|nr:translational GTPase TypA [Candidatus Woesebacteria bacterium]